MQHQRKPTTSDKTIRQHRPRAEYTAAVRYLDGRREIFRIRNADDIADARQLVLTELEGVQAVMIALHH